MHFNQNFEGGENYNYVRNNYYILNVLCKLPLLEGEMQQTYADVIVANVNFLVAFKTILVPVWSLEE